MQTYNFNIQFQLPAFLYYFDCIYLLSYTTSNESFSALYI